MKLSIESLKLQFKQYLIQQGIEPELNDNEELSGASIFTYELEFKDFVEENFKINIDDLSFNIDDLFEMDMEDGQFVMPEDENKEEVTQDELMLTVLNVPFLQEIFEVVKLPLVDLEWVIGLVIAPIVIVEVFKLLKLNTVKEEK